MRVSTRFLSLNRANKSVNVLFEEQDEKRGKSDNVNLSEFFVFFFSLFTKRPEVLVGKGVGTCLVFHKDSHGVHGYPNLRW